VARKDGLKKDSCFLGYFEMKFVFYIMEEIQFIIAIIILSLRDIINSLNKVLFKDRHNKYCFRKNY